jgi:hypothetical protein
LEPRQAYQFVFFDRPAIATGATTDTKKATVDQTVAFLGARGRGPSAQCKQFFRKT